MAFKLFLSWAFTVPIFILLDLLWLGVVMKDFYRGKLGHLLSPEVNWYAAAAFYIIFTLGLYYFAVHQGLSRQSLMIAIVSGALFGFFAYATYDLTNMATLKHWPLSVTLVDIAWGTALGAFVAWAGYVMNRFFLG